MICYYSACDKEGYFCKNFQLLWDTPNDKNLLSLLTCYLKQDQQGEHNVFYHLHPNQLFNQQLELGYLQILW